MDQLDKDIQEAVNQVYEQKLGMKGLVALLRDIFSRRIVREVSRIAPPEPDVAKKNYKAQYAYRDGFKECQNYYELEQLKIIKKYGNLETTETNTI